jgi:hypothetical protein
MDKKKRERGGFEGERKVFQRRKRGVGFEEIEGWVLLWTRITESR